MGENAPRYQPTPVRADVYWRRRVVALAIGLAVVGLISWAVNGTLSTPASGQAAAGAARPGGPGPGTGGAGPGGGSQAGQAAVPGSPPATPASRLAGHAAGSTSVSGSRQQTGQGGSRHSGQAAACPGSDVVLSLHQPHASYRGRAWPQFEVDVVSTAAQPCTFNTGSRHVSVVVRSGRRPLWNSATCASGTGSSLAVLSKGVPAVLHFRWDRKAGRTGCPGSGRLVKPGAFVATAVSGPLISNSLIFVLRAPGLAVP